MNMTKVTKGDQVTEDMYLNMNLADCNRTKEDGTESDQVTADIHPNVNMTNCEQTTEDGMKLGQVTEEPEGILQLIDKLEDIVDQMVPW